jgi:hypothetical protein
MFPLKLTYVRTNKVPVPFHFLKKVACEFVVVRSVLQRFHELKNDERLWLTVTHRSQQLKLPRNFSTLKEAVISSR